MILSLGRRLLSFRGRTPRATFWWTALLVGSVFVVLFTFLEATFGPRSSLVLYPPFFWAVAALAVRRLHDRGRSPAWLLVALVQILGPLWLLVELGFRRGTPGENRYGPDPREAGDYFTVRTETGPEKEQIVNDVTGLNPVGVWAIATPTRIEEVQEALRRSTGSVSIGGGHFSMGGQTASPGSLHLDMRRLNKVVELAPQRKTIRVQAGIRWCDIQRFIDSYEDRKSVV